MRRISFAFFILGFCSSCATIEALKSPSSDYRSYVDSSLMTTVVYDAGRQLVNLKALRGTQELKNLQEQLAPGFGFDKKEEFYQIIISLSLAHPGGFSKSDLKIHLNDFEATHVKEVSGSPLLENLYYFAYPHHRVFVIDFPKEVASASEKTLRVKTARGEGVLSYKDNP